MATVITLQQREALLQLFRQHRQVGPCKEVLFLGARVFNDGRQIRLKMPARDRMPQSILEALQAAGIPDGRLYWAEMSPRSRFAMTGGEALSWVCPEYQKRGI